MGNGARETDGLRVLAMLLVFGNALADVGGDAPAPGFYLDLLNLQWWQAFVALLAILGLSPAPWLTGLALGRIQFAAPARKDFERQRAEAELAHEKALAEKDRHYQALLGLQQTQYADLKVANDKNQARADELTDAAFEMTEVVRANNHFMTSLSQVAREVTENDRTPRGE